MVIVSGDICEFIFISLRKSPGAAWNRRNIRMETPNSISKP